MASSKAKPAQGNDVLLGYRKNGRKHLPLGRWIAFALLGVLAAFAWSNRKDLRWDYDRAKLLYLQWRAMNHTLSADTVVYEEEPKRVDELLAMKNHYAPMEMLSGFPELARSAGRRAGYLPDLPLEKLSDALDFHNFRWFQIFTHSRTSKGGRQCLVVAHVWSVDYDAESGERTLWIRFVAIPKIGWTVAPRERYRREITAGQIFLKSSDRLRLFAGQPSPDDPSKFTIDYELNGKRGTLQWELTDKFPGGKVTNVSGDITATLPETGNVINGREIPEVRVEGKRRRLIPD